MLDVGLHYNGLFRVEHQVNFQSWSRWINCTHILGSTQIPNSEHCQAGLVSDLTLYGELLVITVT